MTLASLVMNATRVPWSWRRYPYHQRTWTTPHSRRHSDPLTEEAKPLSWYIHKQDIDLQCWVWLQVCVCEQTWWPGRHPPHLLSSDIPTESGWPGMSHSELPHHWVGGKRHVTAVHNMVCTNLHMTTDFLLDDFMRAPVSICSSVIMDLEWGSPPFGQLISCKAFTVSGVWLVASSTDFTSILLSTMSPWPLTLTSLTESLPHTISSPSSPGQ